MISDDSISSQLVKGLGAGCFLISEKAAEEKYLQGMSFFAVAMIQAAQLSAAVMTIAAIRGCDLPVSSLKYQVGILLPTTMIYFANRAMLYAKAKDARFEKAYSVTYFACRHAGDVCQIASLISSLALMRLGQKVRGCGTLALIIYGWVARNRSHWIPQEVRSSAVLPMRIAGIVYQIAAEKNPTWLQLMALGNLFSIVLMRKKRDRHFQKQDLQPITLPKKPIGHLFSDENSTTDICRFSHLLKLDEQHYRAKAYQIPEMPEVDWKEKFDEVIAMHKAIDWNNEVYAQMIKNTLANDERWQKMPAEEKTNGSDYIQHGLEQWIVGVGEKRIAKGEPTSYKRIQLLSKHIIQNLHKVDEKTRASKLLQLGSTANNCGGSYLDYIEPVFEELMDTPSELELQGQVLRVLRNGRSRIFDGILYRATLFTKDHDLRNLAISLFLMNPFVSINNPHKYNRILDAVGINLGLPLAEAAHEEGTSADYLDQLTLALTLKKKFTAEYRDQIVEIIREGLKNEEISSTLFTQWRNEHKISANLAWDADDDCYSDEVIYLLLINMGILQIK